MCPYRSLSLRAAAHQSRVWPRRLLHPCRWRRRRPQGCPKVFCAVQFARSSAHDSYGFILCPVFGALNCILPALTKRCYLVAVDLRCKTGVILAVRPDVLGALPEADSKTCEIRCAKRSCFGHGWTKHRDSEKVSLKLHEHVVHCGAPVHAQFSEFVV